jgi:hypothetical protein
VGVVKRKDAILAMIFAGYHADSATWTRVWLNHRISRTVANEAWAKGAAAKARGVPCGCRECKPATPAS